MNALCALGLVIGTGADADDAAHGALEKLGGVHADLELVATALRRSGYVDYAHTPDALETVQEARVTRPMRSVNWSWCSAAAATATGQASGDGRTGIPPLPTAPSSPTTTPAPRLPRRSSAGSLQAAPMPRRSATWAKRSAPPSGIWSEGDVLVIAGKGHEQGQIVGTEIRPFDDAETARAAVREVLV